MHSDYFQELRSLFEKLPGIGPRQAARFIWAMLDFAHKERGRLAELILNLDKNLMRCSECFRAFAASPCSFCQPTSSRDHSKIMIVERDSDLLNIEKTKIYSGLYHVLGGVLDPLEKSDEVRRRIKKLRERVSGGVIEIILALSPTKMGEFTASFIEKALELMSKSQNVKISRLGRGLSTGTDLEYADETTLRQALDNRK